MSYMTPLFQFAVAGRALPERERESFLSASWLRPSSGAGWEGVLMLVLGAVAADMSDDV